MIGFDTENSVELGSKSESEFAIVLVSENELPEEIMNGILDIPMEQIQATCGTPHKYRL